ncbi:MAG: hypothetical protein J5523_05565 [Muribaculaceae bacterium]|nr:hypothetical protein [Muribaculaceae bacterium]
MTGGVTLLESAYWRLEGMDKDLTTKENYFAVDPSEFIGPDSEGKYWTTLRVCFNMLYETSEITPYIVTAADATTGTMELTEVTGGIIPEKTCVLLKCNSTDVTRNVMIPTTSTSSFNTSGNLLTSSTYYYKNQSVSSSLNLKGIKLVDGRIGFGGSTLTKVDGNRAYLPIASDVSIIPPYISTTLAALIASGDTQHTYIITDLTGVDVVDHDRILICKDNNGYADKDEISENYIDFMHTATGLAIDVPATYDQSNWIGLRLPEGEELTSVVFGSPLKGVVGKLVDTVNPEFQLIQMPEATTGTPASTNLNPFIAASFYGANHQTGNNNKVYFFVQPKPMELANIEMAQWDGTKFITPVHDAAHPNWNTAELTGGFEFNGSYMTNVDMSVLQTGHSYKMTPSLIKLKTINNPTHVYVLGNVNGLDWSPMKGVEMFTNDGNVYTATLTVKDVNNGYGYFSFSKKLNTDWEGDNGILNYRFGAVANGNNYTIFDNLLNQQLPLSEMGQTKSFEIASGTYSLTVNLQNKTLVVKPATTQAPRLNEASNKSYVVYPLSLTKVTTTQDGVITEVADISSKQVAGVKYYNLAGIESSEPHQGVNIVVTTYTDGSRSSAKVLR